MASAAGDEPSSSRNDTIHDVVIYGGTSAAITAAIQVKSMGQTVIVVSPDKHLGGLTAGGLGWTDSGRKEVVGGLAKQFYQRVYKHYQQLQAWTFQEREAYGNRAQGHQASDEEDASMWVFEPHVAEQIIDDWMAENDIVVVREAWLDRENGVVVEDGKILSIRTLDGRVYAGKQFMDTTYEGDLVAAAGVQTTFGREGIADYNEPHAGVQTGVLHHAHHFDVLKKRVDPYVVPGDPSSGVIPLVSDQPPGEFGSADKRVQAYCFRTCMTNHADNLLPWPKPEGYDPAVYEIMIRCFDAGWKDVFNKFDPLPNFKTDTNNHGPVSFDNIGMNYDYPEATYERRREIIAQHEQYQKGLLYFIANDPRVPTDIQERMRSWGLAKDEFTDNGNWPHQIYVREARRMVGDFVMTENHLRKDLPTPESVGMGSYAIDSHNTQRYITPEGYVQNEGDLGVSTNGPYEIAMGALLPKASQCTNLTVPVCVSATHAAFGSIRMEPVFMILGQSAATIAAMANEQDIPVQKVAYEQVKQRLLSDGQVLQTPPNLKVAPKGNPVSSQSFPGVTVDDADANRTGHWTASHSSNLYVDAGYQHNGNDSDVTSTATFTGKLPTSGWYEVRMIYPHNSNRCADVPVTVAHADGQTTIRVNQKQNNSKGHQGTCAAMLGRYRFAQGTDATVTISDEGTDGYVVIDAINWEPIEP
nr:FAD-dependent oxidoreductase [Neorhodopirellula pilleata]